MAVTMENFAIKKSLSNLTVGNETTMFIDFSTIGEPADSTLKIVLPICGIVFVLLLVVISYRVYNARRMNDLRRRLFSLRRYDPALNGSKASTVQTPDLNHDPLLMYSIHDSKRRPETRSNYSAANTV